MGDLQRERETMQAVVDQQEREKARYALLDDYTTLARDVLGLAVEPGKGIKAWFPFDDEKWPYRRMAAHLDVDNGKDKALFCSRGVGKSVLAQMLQMKRIIKNRDHTLRIGSESKLEVTGRSLWIRNQLTQLEPEYGPFRGTGEWGKDRFTIVRPGRGVLDQTVTLTSPDSPGTGAHPDSFLLDDAVGDVAEQSQATMESGVEWYKRLSGQSVKGTRTWVIGTFRLGWNIYRYIIEHIEKGLRLHEVARGCWLHEGKQFDILVCRATDKNGEVVFPCYDQEHLEQRRIHGGKAQYKSQFDLLLPGSEDTTFNVKSVRWDDPPSNTPLRTLILTDTATSTGKTRHTSMSAIVAVSKTPDNHAYVREIRMGKIPPEKVPEIILELWKRWGAEKIVHENYARGYISAVRALAKAQGVSEDVVNEMFKELDRPTDKHFRIQAWLSPHTEQHMLHFSRAIDDDILRVDEDNRLQGMLGREFENYYYSADGSWDGLDTLADIWGEDKYRVPTFQPPQKNQTVKRNEQWYEYAERITRERFGGNEGVF